MGKSYAFPAVEGAPLRRGPLFVLWIEKGSCHLVTPTGGARRTIALTSLSIVVGIPFLGVFLGLTIGRWLPGGASGLWSIVFLVLAVVAIAASSSRVNSWTARYLARNVASRVPFAALATRRFSRGWQEVRGATGEREIAVAVRVSRNHLEEALRFAGEKSG